MIRYAIVTLLVGISLMSCAPRPTASPGTRTHKWERLGERMVNHGHDHDVISVTARDGAFTGLKLAVLRAPIHLTNVRVEFGNGTSENFVINRNIPAGAETRVLDLPGNKRIIHKVVFNYRTLPARARRGTVVLFGRH